MNKRFFIVILAAFAFHIQSWAQYDLYVLVDQPGTLGAVVEQISETAKYETKSMKVMGTIDGVDMMYIRDMCGVTQLDTPTPGQLTVLDLGDVDIIGTDEVYLSMDGIDYTTHDGVFGTAFLYNCANLTTLELPVSINTIDTLALANCKGLTDIIIPGDVQEISYGAFYGCSGITQLFIPDFTSIIGTGAFQGMSMLEELTLGNQVKTIDVSVLEDDDNLKIVNLGKHFNSYEPVAFANHMALSEINVHEENPYYVSHDGVVYTTSMDTLVAFPPASNFTEYVIPDTVSTIDMGAFLYAASLQSVTLGAGVRQIKTLAFHGCEMLSEVNLNEGLESIAYGAFSMPLGVDAALQSMVIPASVNYIQPGAFLFHNGLRKLQVDAGNTLYSDDGAGNIYDAGKTIVYRVPCSVDQLSLPETVRTIAPYAMAGLSSMTRLTVDDNIGSVGERAFAFSTSLRQLTFGKGVRQMGEHIVEGCDVLSDIYFFPGDINDDKVGEETFYDSQNRILHVMPGKISYYRQKKGFADANGSFFSEIREIDNPDGVHAVMAESTGGERYYDVEGKQRQTPGKGINVMVPLKGKSTKRIFR